MGRLAGKVVIVTGAGAATGIGAEIARSAAVEGAFVLLADIDEAGAVEVAEEINRAIGNDATYAIKLDLADEDSISEMIASATRRWGSLHALVNNAADTSLVARDGKVETMDLDVWDKTLNANLRGTMLACRYAIPALRASGGGAIVNIASGAALRGGPGLSAYGVSKAGVVSLGQYIAAQHGSEGIRCNTIAPGIILTPKTEPTFGGAEKWKRLKAHMLSPRLGKPHDIASAVLWLISDEGTYMNGQCLSIDGGQMSHQNLLIGAVAGI